MSFVDTFQNNGAAIESDVCQPRSKLPTPLGEMTRPDLAPTMMTRILETWRVAGTRVRPWQLSEYRYERALLGARIRRCGVSGMFSINGHR